jgi:hypothetical protein
MIHRRGAEDPEIKMAIVYDARYASRRDAEMKGD